MNIPRNQNGEILFDYDKCGKTFSRKGNLKVHTSTHTRERPLTREMCKKSFSRNSNLEVHTLERHHLIVKYVEKLSHRRVI